MDYKSIRDNICTACDERATCEKTKNQIDNCLHAIFPLECR